MVSIQSPTPRSPVFQYLSPPQRLPPGIFIRAGDDGKREKGASLLCSLFPSCPAPPLFLSPQLPHNTKRPLRRRESQYRSQIHPSDLVTSINCLLISGRKNVMSMRELFCPDPLTGFENMAGFQIFYCLKINCFHS